MRNVTKYKYFSKKIIDLVPVRINKFKRAKWQKIKIFFLKKKINKRFILTCGVLVSSKIFPRLKSYFKDCLMLNLAFKQFFGSRAKINAFENNKVKEFNNFFNKIFIKQFFKPEILLWKLNFFCSSEEVTQYLANGDILINLKKKTSNYFLKQGDVITFNSQVFQKLFFNENVLNKKFFLKKSIFPFVEIDFFLKSIIILKDVSNIGVNDLHLSMPFFFDIQYLKNV